LNLIKISATDDPSEIARIDIKNNIIMCVTENNNNIQIVDNDILLSNPANISFNNQKVLPNNFTSINYAPNIRWSIPNFIDIIFEEPYDYRVKTYFSNIYINTTYKVKCDCNRLLSHSFNIYIDRTRSQEMGKIPKGEYLLQIDFVQKVLSEEPIENIYLIQNNYCFQEFETHFNI
jgi:hypothetical protein